MVVATKDQRVQLVQPVRPDQVVTKVRWGLLQPAQPVTKALKELKVLRVETLALVLPVQ